LIQVCVFIREAIYSEFPMSFLTAEDLLPLFTYVLIKAQIPNLYTELGIMGNFILEPVNQSMEGFALATFEASINFMESLATVGQPKAVVQPQINFVPQPNNSQPQYPDFLTGTSFSYTQPPSQPQQLVGSQSKLPEMYEPLSFSPSAYAPENQLLGYNPENQLLGYNPSTLNRPISYSDEQPPPYPEQMPDHTLEFMMNPNELDDLSNKLMQASFKDQFIELPANNGAKFDTLQRVEKSFIRSLKEGPQTVDTHLQLASYYENKGKMIKSIEHCKLALSLEPDNESVRNRLSVLTKRVVAPLSKVPSYG